jgi:DNA-binding IscR family transcriptional regulator
MSIAMENIDLILKTLKESPEPLKSGQIAETTNIDKKIVDKVIKQLKGEELIISPKRCFYTVK